MTLEHCLERLRFASLFGNNDALEGINRIFMPIIMASGKMAAKVKGQVYQHRVKEKF